MRWPHLFRIQRTESRKATIETTVGDGDANEHAVAETIARIENAHWLTDEQFEAALTHEDERVVIVAIKHWRYKMSGRHRWMLFERGARICDEKNVIWHLLFDAMSIYSCWPREQEIPQEWLATHKREQATERYRIMQLRDWINQQSDSAQIEDLLRFQAHAVREAIGRATRLFSKNIIRNVPLAALAQNPYLPDSIARTTAKQAVRLLIASVKPEYSAPIGAYRKPDIYDASIAFMALAREYRHAISPKLSKRLAQQLRKKKQLNCLGALLALGTRGIDEALSAVAEADEEFFQTVLGHCLSTDPPYVVEKLCGNDPPSVLATTPGRSPRQKNGVWPGQRENAGFDPIPAGILARVDNEPRQERREPKWVRRVRENHIEYVIDHLVQKESIRSLEILLEYPPVADHPKIIETLARHRTTSYSALWTLLPCTQGELFRHVFSRLISRNDERTLKQLLNHVADKNPASLAFLCPEDLVPLLESSSSKVRTQAITIIAQIPGDPSPQGLIPTSSTPSNRPSDNRHVDPVNNSSYAFTARPGTEHRPL